MTAEAFASLVEARRTAPGKWQGLCPAHEDRSPSLSIREGNDGRVLIHCFAGCSHVAIAGALGLSVRELFAGKMPLNSAELAALRTLREERERVAREQRKLRNAAFERAHQWDAIVSRLGEKLERTSEPDVTELVRLFHQACERRRKAEKEADALLRLICPKWRAGNECAIHIV